jgi:glycosyltransferase involved in cell wall biosynthesis
MMTGVVPVCLNNHDVSLFIENGVNGFYADEPGALADFLNHLCRNESEARRIRAAARRTALDVFNHDRYLTAWTELLERIAA